MESILTLGMASLIIGLSRHSVFCFKGQKMEQKSAYCLTTKYGSVPHLGALCLDNRLPLRWGTQLKGDVQYG